MGKQRNWPRLPYQELLDQRICDLGLTLKKSLLQPYVQTLYQEIKSKGLDFRPHCWLALEWFSPKGLPGIAIPFFLAHPNLVKIEERMMFEVEGGTRDWLLRLLRHEAGHAFDTAYRISERKMFRKIFGNPRKPYPTTYRPDPKSKKFVRHLGFWYAQAHPVEDFAETFAVWLKPRSGWRRLYRHWPAWQKLEYVNQLMSELAKRKPLNRSRKRDEPVSEVKTTLYDYYRQKRIHYLIDRRDEYDEDLSRVFSRPHIVSQSALASSYLRTHRDEILQAVSKVTQAETYLVDQVLHEMILRARYLNLLLESRPKGLISEVIAMVAIHVRKILKHGFPRVVV